MGSHVRTTQLYLYSQYFVWSKRKLLERRPDQSRRVLLEPEYYAAREVQLVLQRGLEMDHAIGPCPSDTAPEAAVGSRQQCGGPTSFSSKPNMTGEKILDPAPQGK